MTSPSVEATGQAPAAAGQGPFNEIQFMIRQILGRTWTSILVEVLAVTPAPDPLAPVGSVNVKPLVDQMDGAGNVTPHGVIFNVPFFRLQGGANAVVIDPQVGDIGLAIVAARDISSVKATKAAATPGSRRRFDLADSLYLGGFLNAVPTQYVRFTAAGVQVVSPTAITLTAPTITLDGAVIGSMGAVFTDDVTAAGISLETHIHGGVEPGAGNTDPPT